MSYGTNAEDSDRPNRHRKDNAPHPCKNLHYKMSYSHVLYMSKWVVVAIHDQLVESLYQYSETKQFSSPYNIERKSPD